MSRKRWSRWGGGREEEGRRKGGGDSLGSDATILWSWALTHPPPGSENKCVLGSSEPQRLCP